MRNNPRINAILFSSGACCLKETCWCPQADVYRGPQGWLIKFDLAGVRPEDVEVSFDGSVLTVSGIRRDLFVEEGYHNYSMEISYSHFERGIRLPDDLNSAYVTTDFRDGMLLVKVKK
ncbi:MAG: Hsp20/alpha crystallin family protein [Blastocatellia bacterium]|nr:Hsp20/alpha crystallin family protein [Blastocatellia bacterium]